MSLQAPLPTLLRLPFTLERAPPPFETNAIKYPESLVRYYLKAFTQRGATVFDPFAGLGTTLFVAEAMQRVPYGIETDAQRHAWVAGQLRHWLNLRHADAYRMERLGMPKLDFCMTSPPFMRINDRWNPLFAGDPARAGYAAYLRRMRGIFVKLPAVMRRGATVIVQVDNIEGRAYTPLVRDLGQAMAAILQPLGETIVLWDDAPKGYPLTHCLLFRVP